MNLGEESKPETPEDPEMYWQEAYQKIDQKVCVFLAERHPELELEIALAKSTSLPGRQMAEYRRKIFLGFIVRGSGLPGFAIHITDPSEDFIENELTDLIDSEYAKWRQKN